jgi:hypothetical protein
MNKILAFPWLLFRLLVFVLLASRSADAQVAKETPLMTRALTDVPGREVALVVKSHEVVCRGVSIRGVSSKLVVARHARSMRRIPG